VDPLETAKSAVGLWTGSNAEGWTFSIAPAGKGMAELNEKTKNKATLQLILKNIKDNDEVHAFYNGARFSAPLKIHVVRTQSENDKLLRSKNPLYVYERDGLHIVPLRRAMQGYGRRMSHVFGMAVHITDGNDKTAAESFAWWDNGAANASTHFVIDQSGNVAQYLALCYQACAQGDPADHNWVSVELVGNAHQGNEKLETTPTDKQLAECARLFGWLSKRFGFPKRVASPYIGNAGPTPAIVKMYQEIGQELGEQAKVEPSESRSESCFSRGISCHYWLNNKLCPGPRVMRNLLNIVRGS
jgi:hypothetical protein